MDDFKICDLKKFQATRKICGAVKSGVREFTTTGFKIMTGSAEWNNFLEVFLNFVRVYQPFYLLHFQNSITGCTNHPAPGQKFCTTHQNHESPVVTPDQMSRESLNQLNNQHSNREKFLMTGLERDNIFVVEGVIFALLYNVLEVVFKESWKKRKQRVKFCTW